MDTERLKRLAELGDARAAAALTRERERRGLIINKSSRGRGDRWLIQQLERGRWRGVEVLELSDNRLTPAGLRALEDAALPALRVLSLNNNPRKGLEAFFGSALIAQLRGLHLRGIRWPEPSRLAEALAYTPFAALEILELDGAWIQDDGLEWLLQNEHLSTLRRLSLRNNGLTHEGVESV